MYFLNKKYCLLIVKEYVRASLADVEKHTGPTLQNKAENNWQNSTWVRNTKTNESSIFLLKLSSGESHELVYLFLSKKIAMLATQTAKLA